MKTMTKLGFSLMLLFLVSFFTQANAQSHDIKARNCKYWKKSPNPGSGAEVTDFSVCKVCSEKKDKEAAAKRAEDKRRADALVAKTKADNERKAKEAAEKQRLQNEKNKPVNATIVMSPNTGGKTDDAKNILPFEEGAKYSILLRKEHRKVRPCYYNTWSKDGTSLISNYSIVNRKLEEIVIPSSDDIGYYILGSTPYAIEIPYNVNTSYGIRGCNGKIFNIETKKIITELNNNSEYGLEINREKMISMSTINFELSTNAGRKMPIEFTKELRQKYLTEKFDYLLVAYGDYENKKNAVGYLLWNDGKYKVIKENWLNQDK